METFQEQPPRPIKGPSSIKQSSANNLETELTSVKAKIAELEESPSEFKKLFTSQEFLGLCIIQILALGIDLGVLFVFNFSLFFIPTTLAVVLILTLVFKAISEQSTVSRYLASLKSHKASIEAQLNKPERSNDGTDADMQTSNFDKLVDITITNLNVYYDQVKAHANKSFIASVSMAVLGFLVVLAGLALGYFVKPVDGNTSIQYVTVGAGAIVEFISGVFFYLYNRTVRQMKDYHDSLVSVQNIVLALNLINEKHIDKENMPEIVKQAIGFLLNKAKHPVVDEDE